VERLESHGSSHLHHQSRFNPLDFPICTRLPERHNVLTAWIGHVPFAMCLIALAKPRVLVELGTHWGVSYCAFCQAVKELGLPTRCFAVDTWQGDPHAGFYTSEVLEDLKSHHDGRYGLFSTLLQSSFDEALARFDDGTIDVLHIDGYHTYDAVRHDFENWLPKMSSRAVVLMHDTEVRDRESFGVWRFWDEIRELYPHFGFRHSNGLGIVAVGKSVPEGLRVFTDQIPADTVQLQTYFENLGDHLGELHSVSLQKENVSELLHAKTDECCQLRGAADEAQRTVIELLNEAQRTGELLKEAQRTGELLKEAQRTGELLQSELWFQASHKAVLLLRRVPFLYLPTRALALALVRMFQRKTPAPPVLL
jgi:methyltransferase family protein